MISIFKIFKKKQNNKINVDWNLQEELINRYKTISYDEFVELPDEELNDIVYSKLIDIVFENDKEIENLKRLKKEFITIYVCNNLLNEINNGGFDYLILENSKLIPFISESLKEINANELNKLFDKFIKKYKFILEELDEDELSEKFDEVYYEDVEKMNDCFYDKEANFRDCIANYIRNNIDKFKILFKKTLD